MEALVTYRGLGNCSTQLMFLLQYNFCSAHLCMWACIHECMRVQGQIQTIGNMGVEMKLDLFGRWDQKRLQPVSNNITYQLFIYQVKNLSNLACTILTVSLECRLFRVSLSSYTKNIWRIPLTTCILQCEFVCMHVCICVGKCKSTRVQCVSVHMHAHFHVCMFA